MMDKHCYDCSCTDINFQEGKNYNSRCYRWDCWTNRNSIPCPAFDPTHTWLSNRVAELEAENIALKHENSKLIEATWTGCQKEG